MHQRHPDHVDFAGALNDVDPLSVEVFHAFRRAMYLQKALVVRKLAEKDMHPGQAMCLWALAKSDGMAQRDLADKLGVTRPTVTVMLQKMEKAGLIERNVDAEDQRLTRISVTAAGRAVHDELQKVHAEVINSTIGLLSEHEQRDLAKLLGALSANAAEALHGNHDANCPFDKETAR